MSTVSRRARLIAYTLSVIVVVALGLAVVISFSQLGVSWPLLALFGLGPTVLVIIIIIVTLGATNFAARCGHERSSIRNACIQQEVSVAGESGICSICMDVYDKEENVILLGCSHMYHCRCFNLWFNYMADSDRAFFCPVCRMAIQK